MNKSITEYLDEMRAMRASDSTIHNYKWALNMLNDFKPIDQVEKKDLIKFFKGYKGSDNSLSLIQAIIIKFFTNNDQHDLVSWIERKPAKESLKSDDILTTDDINAMINATDSYYWKALIAFLYETGARISEATKLKYQDFQDTDHGMIVNIPTTKTAAGFRKVILPFSSQYIRNLKTLANVKNEDIVFGFTYPHHYNTLVKIAQAAKITKPISPHKFRHAQHRNIFYLILYNTLFSQHNVFSTTLFFLLYVIYGILLFVIYIFDNFF